MGYEKRERARGSANSVMDNVVALTRIFTLHGRGRNFSVVLRRIINDEVEVDLRSTENYA